MDTKNFVDLIKKFGNDNTKQQEQQNKMPSFLNEIYPYGQFPSHHTKNADNKNHVHAQEQQSNTRTHTLDNKTASNHQHNNQNQDIFSGIDVKNLLPLIMNMKNKNKFDTYDIFNILMPTLGGDNENMKELMKFFSQSTPKTTEQEKKIKPSKMPSIDSYIKI